MRQIDSRLKIPQTEQGQPCRQESFRQEDVLRQEETSQSRSWLGPLRNWFFAVLVLLGAGIVFLWLLNNVSSSSPTSLASKSTQTKQSAQSRDSKRSSEKNAENSQAKEKARESANSQTSPSETPRNRSYEYLGSVSRDVPKTRSSDNETEGGMARTSTSSSGTDGPGDSQSEESGEIPELTIRLQAGQSIQEIAERLGYQMVAMSKSQDVILRRIEDGLVRPMEESALSRYSSRARAAKGHKRYAKIRKRVARQTRDHSPSDIKLIYLVPKPVEKRFVNAQMRAIERRGLSPDEVVVVEAQYSGSSIEVTRVRRQKSTTGD